MLPQALVDFASKLPNERVVLFAGAGISVGAPSTLPNWWDLNEWILRALYDHVRQSLAIEDDYVQILLDYRNNASNSYPPDYQAQFMEECAGTRYFEALTSLDIETTNRCHNALAALASSGALAAIVTTNFDRLIERALERAGVPFCVACEHHGFTRLNEEWQRGEPPALPVVKIHGSTDVVESLIDTRKQRRRGRAQALNTLLDRLLRQHPFLFVGFSGADFQHDRRYLGIWDAVDAAPGFCFLHQPRRPPYDAVRELKEHYGSKAEIVEVDGAQALEYLAGACGAIPETTPTQDAPVPTKERVQDRLHRWAERLDPWLAVRMAAALQEAASLRVNALRILRDAVQHEPGDTPEYYLMLADWVKARLRRARYDDIEMRTAIRQLSDGGHPLAPYYQFLSDAFCMGAITGADAARMQCKQFAQQYEAWLAGYPPTLAVDAILLVCQVASLYRELPALVPALRFACALAKQDGDDIRLAAVQAELAVRLAVAGEIEEARSLFHAASKVAKDLREGRVASTAILAYALIEEHEGRYPEALGAGHMAYQQAVQDELRLCMSRALLAQLRIACRHGGPSNVDFVQRQISQPFEHEFLAHDLERQLYEAEFARRCHDPGALERLTEIANSATRAGMEWIAQEAAKLRE